MNNIPFMPNITQRDIKNTQTKWAWVKYQLQLKGLTLSDLARRLNVTPSAVLNVKTVHYPRIERAIAREIGVSAEAIWPERYQSTTSAHPRKKSGAA